MALEYHTALLEQSRFTGYTIAAAVQRAVDEGWRIHTWTVLKHEHIPNDRNHGHGYDVEMKVSVLFERETAG